MALFTFNDCFRKTDIVNIFPSVVVSDGYVVDHYNKKRSGPRIVPCGTPPFTNSQSDNTDPNFTLCRLCMRKSITQLIGELPMPSNCIFFYEELMVNSIKCLIRTVSPLPSVSKNQQWNMLINASTVEHPFN